MLKRRLKQSCEKQEYIDDKIKGKRNSSVNLRSLLCIGLITLSLVYIFLFKTDTLLDHRKNVHTTNLKEKIIEWMNNRKNISSFHHNNLLKSNREPQSQDAKKLFDKCASDIVFDDNKDVFKLTEVHGHKKIIFSEDSRWYDCLGMSTSLWWR